MPEKRDVEAESRVLLIEYCCACGCMTPCYADRIVGFVRWICCDCWQTVDWDFDDEPDDGGQDANSPS